MISCYDALSCVIYFQVLKEWKNRALGSGRITNWIEILYSWVNFVLLSELKLVLLCKDWSRTTKLVFLSRITCKDLSLCIHQLMKVVLFTHFVFISHAQPKFYLKFVFTKVLFTTPKIYSQSFIHQSSSLFFPTPFSCSFFYRKSKTVSTHIWHLLLKTLLRDQLMKMLINILNSTLIKHSRIFLLIMVIKGREEKKTSFYRKQSWRWPYTFIEWLFQWNSNTPWKFIPTTI